ncbi:MAG TPA: LysM peptidoglycan-binding domain-containing protein [Gaiellaceae bacterium]|nr:LysM peptidoglycan-binding domain-containing protein [Gaiellaceae bacterium]
MVTIPWWVVRYGFPALALAAVTAIVVLARPALHDGGTASRPAPAVSVAEKPRAKPRTKSAQATAYSVRSGDTLASIAEKFGTTVDRLMELNPGVDPTALRVGTPIRVD